MTEPAFAAGGDAAHTEVLWRSGDRVLCRLRSDDGHRASYAYVPVLSNDGHWSPDSIRRLTNEYDLKDHLEPEWALKPLQLVRERWPMMLVVQYVGGEPVDRLVSPPMEIGAFLRLSVALTAAVGQLHKRGLIHKDIKPANVLVEAATGHVRLTGFGIATRLPRERQSPEPPEFIAGTLAYMRECSTRPGAAPANSNRSTV